MKPPITYLDELVIMTEADWEKHCQILIFGPTDKESLTVEMPQDKPQSAPMSTPHPTQTNASQANLERKKGRKI